MSHYNIQSLFDAQTSPLDVAVQRRDADIMKLVEGAVRRRDVLLAYQPIVRADDFGPAFYEGLIRVIDDTGRVIPARDFIGSVETTELGRKLDCLALEMGLKTLAENDHMRLSINMSARSIGYAPWNKILKQGLRASPTVAERLILEITERSAILIPEVVTAFMAWLHRKGISFALDDFGAGFTSFRHMRDLLFDMVKIDGQFIQGIHNSPDNQILTEALISIAGHFDMFVVAEKVEDAADVRFLQEIGVDCMQGYYFGAATTKPVWACAPS
ncbi:EAL domain-containing protein [Brevirhabdus sp.]|uniref:EAL domain-containing protein n=1 Tax=Brevirhabdus sp. TaxID=2004514 RepID=UPI004059A6B3